MQHCLLVSSFHKGGRELVKSVASRVTEEVRGRCGTCADQPSLTNPGGFQPRTSSEETWMEPITDLCHLSLKVVNI